MACSFTAIVMTALQRKYLSGRLPIQMRSRPNSMLSLVNKKVFRALRSRVSGRLCGSHGKLQFLLQIITASARH